MELTSFACTQCEKRYNRNFNLTRHIEEKHTLDKAYTHQNRFKCDFCDYISDKRHKARHFRAKHNGNTHKKRQEKPACAQCDREFHCKSNLNKHMGRFHARKLKTLIADTIVESESDAFENCTLAGVNKDMSERESGSPGAGEDALNGMCKISRELSDHGNISEDIVKQDHTQPELQFKCEKEAKKRFIVMEAGLSEKVKV